MTQPTSLHFVHRFRSGRLGTLVIEHVVYDEERHGPGPLTYTWNGPRPPYGGERLKWTIECQRIFADRFKVIFTYVTADERGKTVIFPVRPWSAATEDSSNSCAGGQRECRNSFQHAWRAVFWGRGFAMIIAIPPCPKEKRGRAPPLDPGRGQYMRASGHQASYALSSHRQTG